MRTISVHRVLAWALGLSTTFLSHACFNPIEGCLDLDASNYDVEADNPCDGCCQYPELKLVFRHKRVLPDTTINLNYNTTLTDDFGQDFRIGSVTYFLQGAGISSGGGSRQGVVNKVDLFRLDQPGDTVKQTFEDNFFRLEANNFSEFSMGEVRVNGSFDRFELLIGLESEAQQVLPSEAPIGHPLDAEVFWSASVQRLAQCRIALFRGVSPADTIPEIIQIIRPDPLMELSLNGNLLIPQGYSPRFSVQVDYEPWFDGVDVVNDSAELIADKVKANMIGTVSLVDFNIELE